MLLLICSQFVRFNAILLHEQRDWTPLEVQSSDNVVYSLDYMHHPMYSQSSYSDVKYLPYIYESQYT